MQAINMAPPPLGGCRRASAAAGSSRLAAKAESSPSCEQWGQTGCGALCSAETGIVV